jgi:hypothetical protein
METKEERQRGGKEAENREQTESRDRVRERKKK